MTATWWPKLRDSRMHAYVRIRLLQLLENARRAIPASIVDVDDLVLEVVQSRCHPGHARDVFPQCTASSLKQGTTIDSNCCDCCSIRYPGQLRFGEYRRVHVGASPLHVISGEVRPSHRLCDSTRARMQ